MLHVSESSKKYESVILVDGVYNVFTIPKRPEDVVSLDRFFEFVEVREVLVFAVND